MLHPKTDKDFEYVKLKNVLRLKNSENKKADIENVKIFIQKRVKGNMERTKENYDVFEKENRLLIEYEGQVMDEKMTLDQIKDMLGKKYSYVQTDSQEQQFKLIYYFKKNDS